MTDRPPLTNRRGFIVATGSAILGLYGLWAAYGAAPLPWNGGGGKHDGHDAPDPGGHDPGGHNHGAPAPAEAGHSGHSGHGGHGEAGGPSTEAFRAEAEAFAERYRQPDGSVAPGVMPMAATHDHGHGHDESPAAEAPVDGPVDVYLAAFQWGFEPAVLRLRRGVAYRFKMMAVDVGHGASIHLGPASRIIRLRPGALVEQQLTFARPGSYLVYCTVFCGPGHDRMQGRIVVA